MKTPTNATPASTDATTLTASDVVDDTPAPGKRANKVATRPVTLVLSVTTAQALKVHSALASKSISEVIGDYVEREIIPTLSSQIRAAGLGG
jgi:hypothetical protein